MKIGLREMTFVLLLLGVLAGAGYFVFYPSYQEVEQDRRRSQEQAGRLAQLDRLGETSESLARELDELNNALKFFESKLPGDQQIHTMLREVTQITERCGLTTRSVRTLKQSGCSDYVAQPIEMELSGPFEGVYRFLLDLEKMPRLTRVTQMELSKDKAAEGVVQGKMVVCIYFEPSKDAVVPPAAAQRQANAAGGRP